MLTVLVSLGLILLCCLICLACMVESIKAVALKMDNDRKRLADAILNRPEGHPAHIIDLAVRAYND